MKKIITLIVIALTVISCNCAKPKNNVKILKLEKGERLINVSYTSHNHLAILTRKRTADEYKKTYTFKVKGYITYKIEEQ